MNLTWVSLIPPFVVIGAIAVTRRLNVSLFMGIVSAILIVTKGHIFSASFLLCERVIAHFSDMGNIYLYLSLIAISSLITLLTATGSAAACAQIIGRRMHTKRGVEASSILLSFLLSIDDYLSILTVGFVMRPLVDRLGVARAKLAYIVHSLSGPLAIIMPISTWAATILAQLDNAGINLDPTSKILADPFYVYIKTIPFIFYSLFTIVCVWFVVVRKITYGSMYQHEKNTVERDEPLFEAAMQKEAKKHSLLELIMPIALLIGVVIVGILYAGSYHLFGGTNSFFEAFRQNNQTFLILFVAGCTAFISSTLLSLRKKIVTVRALPWVIWEGIVLIQAPIVMVILASILGSFLRLDLQTGSYVAYLLLGTVPLYFIPAMLFVTSLAITLTTGSAWGTFSLLIPITTQMIISFVPLESPVLLAHVPLLFPTLGALLSGASCGDHISPFSETTIMIGTSTGIEPLVHTRTQFILALPVVIGTFCAFVVAGLLCHSSLCVSFFASVSAGVSIAIMLLWCGNRFLR